MRLLMKTNLSALMIVSSKGQMNQQNLREMQTTIQMKRAINMIY